MTDEPKSHAARLLAELAREQLRGSAHPAPETLTAYQAGELDAAAAEELQAHLAVCPECTEALLSIPRFYELMEADELPAPRGTAGVPTQAQTDTSWQALRARLALTPPVALSPPLPSSGRVVRAEERFRRIAGSPVTISLLAAGLAACLIGFPLWIATHRVAPLALSAPGSEVTRGEEVSGHLLTVREAEATVLLLPLPSRALFPAYRIDIRTPTGELRLSAEATPVAVAEPPTLSAPRHPTPPRLVTVEIPGGRLTPGEYRLRLVGMGDVGGMRGFDGMSGEVLEEFPVQVLGG